ncbi:hypothetical protein [Cupriavidus sp. IDO]|uniref:hypothetical protein n=1 Tax=Cupriavidus sp. IDO TaxID=1539142 RepID=UPI000579114E|nr:hypothetical protein [Cupriavidus sp. IDO]KWR88140.1 hypothetical protein RM96_21440 [Cupriavidus sp. IDO]
MKGLPGGLAAYIAFGLVVSTSSQASDIACRTTLRPAGCDDLMSAGEHCQSQPDRHASARRLICDYALLHIAYERIYAEQQRMLRADAIDDTDIMAWRKRRDACTSVDCLDGVFASWWQSTAQKRPARGVTQPQKPVEAPLHDAPRAKVARDRPKDKTARTVPREKAASAVPKRGEPSLAMAPIVNPSALQPLIGPEANNAQPAVPVPVPESEVQPEVQSEARPEAPPAAQTRWIKTPLPQERGARSWGPLSALAWLGMCGAGLACGSRRMRRQWMPYMAGICEQVRGLPARTLVLAGLAAVNGLLLLLILTES